MLLNVIEALNHFQLGALSLGIYGSTQIEANFAVNDYIKEGTYVREWIDLQTTHFSSAKGDSGTIYIGGGGLDFSANMDKVKELILVSCVIFV